MRKFTILAFLLLATVITACSAVPATGDTSNQALSAQSQMPEVAGYSTVNADSIQGAINAAATAASLSTANLFGAAAINRIDAFVACYRDVGAIDVKGYFSITEAGGGVAAVINNDRVANNLVQCVAQAAGNRNGNNQAQGAEFQPCVKGGSFQVTAGDVTNTFSYVYMGSTPTLCNGFQAHFAAKGGQ